VKHSHAPASSITHSDKQKTRAAFSRKAQAEQSTYIAWILTGVAALATGVAIDLMFANIGCSGYGVVTGSVLILYSGFCYVAAVWRSIEQHAVSPLRAFRLLPGAKLITISAALIVIDLAVLTACWVTQAPLT
jgi:putative membrane protein